MYFLNKWSSISYLLKNVLFWSHSKLRKFVKLFREFLYVLCPASPTVISLLAFKTELLKHVFYSGCLHRLLLFSLKPTLISLLPFPIPNSSTTALIQYTNNDLYIDKSSEQPLFPLFSHLAAAFDPVCFLFLSFSYVNQLFLFGLLCLLPLLFFLFTYSLDGLVSALGFKYHPKY